MCFDFCHQYAALSLKHRLCDACRNYNLRVLSPLTLVCRWHTGRTIDVDPEVEQAAVSERKETRVLEWNLLFHRQFCSA